MKNTGVKAMEAEMNIGKKYLKVGLLMLTVWTLAGLSAQARIDDFNDDIKENLKEEKILRKEMARETGSDRVRKQRQRIVVEEDKVAASYIAPTSGDKFKFGREKHKHYNPREDRNSKRLATEMGQFQGQ